MTMHSLLQSISEDFFYFNDSSTIEEMIRNGKLDSDVNLNMWLGYTPATISEIEALENKIQMELPPSYREFLLTSNGFRNISFFLDNLLPADKVDWTRNSEKKWLELLAKNLEEDKVTDEEYFVYGNEQMTETCRNEYFVHSLKVSDWYEGMCVFLNPIVKFETEWEVIVYATWYPGAHRYQSFKKFLEETHKNNLDLLDEK